ncbi:hypothetical protein IJG14_08990 [bacterium]|nr:hypothetical protein [bacterium]
MNKGTFEGDIDEIKFVQDFNSNKDKYNNFLSNFQSFKNLLMVRVTTKQLSQLSGKKVFTRSDCYLSSISDNIQNIIKENDYYLSEEILDSHRIKYQKIPYSGVSIKMTTSNKFQILKTGPNSFKSLFNCYELGAGASLFCMRKEELVKNRDVIKGWKTSIDNMTNFFDKFTKGDELFYLNQQKCADIKNFSNLEIKRIIDESQDLQKKIFNGIGLYEEPYTAYYFYHGKQIKILTTIPYIVTTGSGRSKGNYTIVLKP